MISFQKRNEGEILDLKKPINVVKTITKNGYSLGLYVKFPLKKMKEGINPNSFEMMTCLHFPILRFWFYKSFKTHFKIDLLWVPI